MPEPTCSLVFFEAGRPVHAMSLRTPSVILGRGIECDVVLAHSTVSRRHAEILFHDGKARVRDLGGRNGVRINGVPRRQATLHDGDLIELGQQALQFRTGHVALPTARLPPEIPEQELRPSVELARRLPAEGPHRHLLALYHVCAWLADGEPPGELHRSILRVLLEGLALREAQLYAADGQLEQQESAEGGPTGFKFAAYLCKRFQAVKEVTPFAAAEMGRFQARAGDFNALVCPLRAPALQREDGGFVLVALREREWEPFTPQDRTLAQAVVHMMALGPHHAAEWRRTLEGPATTLPASDENALLGDSKTMIALRAQLRQVAATRATALITGESGSGKEAVAHYLHAQGPRPTAPFITVNCAALPAALVESELFGHARGAFTDAKEEQPGKFALAQGGTLFLDEVGELPLAVQAKLLRALETGEIERLGATTPVRVQVRVLAATNRNLSELTATGSFRVDLYHRLNVVPVAVPPLRAHREDIALLAAHFLRLVAPDRRLEFSPHAVRLLTGERWPGNVRELRNLVQRCATYAEGPIVSSSLVRRCLAM